MHQAVKQRIPCVWCGDTAFIKPDKNGAPYVLCPNCETRSFVRSWQSVHHARQLLERAGLSAPAEPKSMAPVHFTPPPVQPPPPLPSPALDKQIDQVPELPSEEPQESPESPEGLGGWGHLYCKSQERFGKHCSNYSDDSSFCSMARNTGEENHCERLRKKDDS